MLRFYGGTFWRFSNVPVETRAPALIRHFLHAVQHPAKLGGSGKQIGLLNRSDTLEIYLKSAGKNDDPLQCRFLGRTKYPARDCFGAEFVAALQALGKAEAKRYAALAKKLRGKVRAITAPNNRVIRNKAEISQFLLALQSLDERALRLRQLECRGRFVSIWNLKAVKNKKLIFWFRKS